MKKVYETPKVEITQIVTFGHILEGSMLDHADSKKFSGNKFGSESSFQNDGTFGGQKSPWEEND